jgi:hypothetical protein
MIVYDIIARQISIHCFSIVSFPPFNWPGFVCFLKFSIKLFLRCWRFFFVSGRFFFRFVSGDLCSPWRIALLERII